MNATTDPIDRLNAALEGRYRISRRIGEGGMAVVYLADDLRHERRVALKVLRPEIAAVVGADRFLAEIKTTANLQHPHILPLFDSGDADSFLYFVMPYVEGENLQQRLEREHWLGVDEAVRIAAQVAEALDYAHRQGIVHRDIKPANILLQDGKPVVSDFGIALAVNAGDGRITQTGLSLGTPRYMSPEQATGDESVGPASDIYSLGCVLYEMLVGEPPHTGSTPQAIVARIITGERRSVRSQRPAVPANVEEAIDRALQKVPADRFSTAQAMADALADASFRTSEPAAAHGGRRFRTSGLAVGLAAAAVIAFGGALLWSAARSAPGGPREISDAPFGPQHYTVELPDSASYVAYGDLAITRDGARLIYTADADGRMRLYVRELRALESKPIRIETDEPVFAPFLSPDGEWIGFFTSRRVGDQSLMSVHKVRVGGGRPVTLADNARQMNGTWTDDEYIVYTGGGEGFTARGLYRVPADGGESEALTLASIPDGEISHHTPFALPGGRGILFRVDRRDSALWAVLIPETGEYRPIPGIGSSMPVKYVGSGHLLVPDAGTLKAIPFDLDRLAPMGEAFTAVDDVQTLEGAGSYASFDVSDGGMLVYAPGGPVAPPQGGPAASLFWMRPDGAEEPLPVSPDSYGFPSVAPDGARIATIIHSGVERADVWVLDAGTGARVRLTSSGFNRLPLWTPDGRYVVFSSDMETERPPELGPNAWFGNVWRAAADGSAPPERLTTSDQNQAVSGVGPDGLILYTALTEANARREVWSVPVSGGEMRPVLTEGANYGSARVSPDGRWLTYATTVTGSREIFVQAYPGGGPPIPLSVGGGSWPLWSTDGDELYYRTGSSVMAVSFDRALGRARGAPRELFSGTFSQPNTGTNYSVAPDGRFLMYGLTRRQVEEAERPPTVTAPSLVAITGFFDQIRERARR